MRQPNFWELKNELNIHKVLYSLSKSIGRPACLKEWNGNWLKTLGTACFSEKYLVDKLVELDFECAQTFFK